MASDKELKVKISTTANTAGIEKTEKGIKRLSSSAYSGFKGFQRVLSGVVGVFMRLNWVIALVSGAYQALSALMEKISGKSDKQAAAAAREAAAQRSLETAVQAQTAAYDAVNAALGRKKRLLENILTLEGRRDEVELANEIDRIENDGGLSEAQKTVRVREARERTKNAAREREDLASGQEVARAKASVENQREQAGNLRAAADVTRDDANKRRNQAIADYYNSIWGDGTELSNRRQRGESESAISAAQQQTWNAARQKNPLTEEERKNIEAAEKAAAAAEKKLDEMITALEVVSRAKVDRDRLTRETRNAEDALEQRQFSRTLQNSVLADDQTRAAKGLSTIANPANPSAVEESMRPVVAEAQKAVADGRATGDEFGNVADQLKAAFEAQGGVNGELFTKYRALYQWLRSLESRLKQQESQIKAGGTRNNG